MYPEQGSGVRKIPERKLMSKAVQKLVEECVQTYCKQVDDVEHVDNRWGKPPSRPESRIAVPVEKPRVTPELRWAARYKNKWSANHAASWHHCMVIQNISRRRSHLSITEEGSTCPAWLCVDKLRTCGQMQRCTIQIIDGAPVFEIITPWSFCTSYDAIATWYGECHANPTRAPDMRLFEIAWVRNDFRARVVADRSVLVQSLRAVRPRSKASAKALPIADVSASSAAGALAVGPCRACC